MLWFNEEQQDFLKSRAQAWEDSKSHPSAQTKFWDQLHRDWAERWLPRRGMDNVRDDFCLAIELTISSHSRGISARKCRIGGRSHGAQSLRLAGGSQRCRLPFSVSLSTGEHAVPHHRLLRTSQRLITRHPVPNPLAMMNRRPRQPPATRTRLLSMRMMNRRPRQPLATRTRLLPMRMSHRQSPRHPKPRQFCLPRESTLAGKCPCHQ